MTNSTSKSASINSTVGTRSRVVILASGNGSNAQAIIDACQSNKVSADIIKVISNIPSAYVLTRAANAGIDALCIDHKRYPNRESFDLVLAKELDSLQADVIVLAGFMRILSEGFVNQFTGKLLNIHPSLLPKYPGLNTHQRALDANDEEHGTSVHFVTPELDGGPVILQAKVPIFESDSADDLAQRVQSQEHEIYPIVVNWLCSKRAILKSDGAYLDGKKLPECGYASE
ncbi:phosphoribosylglycinamide formyltransferase [Glaciecola sp. MH2013]|uniref:phosphoribosylglycinamide formyltransferase n=1 Tax=Glaciecola sp. MH2013 TaxID=2785524 RepID=UPI00189FA1F4|nr:phosphoribosylglycinamide formyltransferase [Glaciecola sp. MH2013]MBF7072884.1 phosphoribosylglycinamide formyltransferase [Glaciecola sp. MH2013]